MTIPGVRKHPVLGGNCNSQLTRLPLPLVFLFSASGLEMAWLQKERTRDAAEKGPPHSTIDKTAEIGDLYASNVLFLDKGSMPQSP